VPILWTSKVKTHIFGNFSRTAVFQKLKLYQKQPTAKQVCFADLKICDYATMAKFADINVRDFSHLQHCKVGMIENDLNNTIFKVYTYKAYIVSGRYSEPSMCGTLLN
jgi:hypothetical protein